MAPTAPSEVYLIGRTPFWGYRSLNGVSPRSSHDVSRERGIHLAGLLHLHHVTGALDDLPRGRRRGVGGMRGRDDPVPGAPYDQHAFSRLSEPPAGLLALLAAREEASPELAQQLTDAIETLVPQDIVQKLARDELGPSEELLHERLQLAPRLRRDESLRVAGVDLIAQPCAGDEG